MPLLFHFCDGCEWQMVHARNNPHRPRVRRITNTWHTEPIDRKGGNDRKAWLNLTFAMLTTWMCSWHRKATSVLHLLRNTQSRHQSIHTETQFLSGFSQYLVSILHGVPRPRKVVRQEHSSLCSQSPDHHWKFETNLLTIPRVAQWTRWVISVQTSALLIYDILSV